MKDRSLVDIEIETLRRKLRETEAQFTAERARLRQFTDCASDLWWEVDAELRFTFVSDRLFEVFGIEPGTLYGKRRDALGRFDRDDAKWQAHDADLTARRPFRNFETLFVDAKGVPRAVAISGVPFFDAGGVFAGYRGVGVDLTDRRKHAEEARQRAEILEIITENIDEGVGLLDKDLRVVACNRRLLDLLKLPAEQFRPGDPYEKAVRYLAALGEYGPGDPEEQVRQRVAMARSTVPMRIERTRRDGVMLEIKSNPLADGGFVITYADITALKQSEAQLRQAQKMDAVGQLTGGVAHDFNNLLTVILGNAEQLSERLKDDIKLRPMAELVHSASLRAADLTRRLLAFARRQPLEPKVVDVDTLLADLESLLQRTLGEQMDIRIARGSDVAPAMVDPSQLETAIINLALNARDAMLDHGILTIETANVVLDGDYAGRESEVEAGDYVMISVADTGSGMSREVVEHAFEPFFTTKDVGKGSGLGLSMVYGFAKQSRGHVKIYSEAGEGTVVKLYLPRAVSASDGVRAAEVAAPASNGGELILLVEDDDLVREFTAGLLEALDYRVLSASTGKDALALLHRHPETQLLLTDVVLQGGMNGRQIAEAALVLMPALKVLYMSGYPEDVIVHRGRVDPGVQLINKPFRRHDLALKLRAVLES